MCACSFASTDKIQIRFEKKQAPDDSGMIFSISDTRFKGESTNRNEKVVTSGPVNCLLVIKTGEREEGTTIGFEVKDGELCCAAGFRFNHPVKVFELN